MSLSSYSCFCREQNVLYFTEMNKLSNPKQSLQTGLVLVILSQLYFCSCIICPAMKPVWKSTSELVVFVLKLSDCVSFNCRTACSGSACSALLAPRLSARFGPKTSSLAHPCPCVSSSAHSVISEEKGQCYRVLESGVGPSSCSMPIVRNITKQICCCSRVGKAWGPDCQRCPYFGSGGSSGWDLLS